MLEISNVSVMRQEAPLLAPFSLRLMPGEAAHLVAENGVGKSTLLKAFLGHYPFLGKIEWGAQSLSEQRDQIHFLPHGDVLFSYLTVQEHLDYWVSIQKGPYTELFWDLLDAFGLTGYLELSTQCLSAGQAKKLALCSLLISHRPLWLLDEPLTALDTLSQTIFLEVINRYLIKGGIIVAASHQVLPVYFQRIPLEPLC